MYKGKYPKLTTYNGKVLRELPRAYNLKYQWNNIFKQAKLVDDLKNKFSTFYNGPQEEVQGDFKIVKT